MTFRELKETLSKIVAENKKFINRVRPIQLWKLANTNFMSSMIPQLFLLYITNSVTFRYKEEQLIKYKNLNSKLEAQIGENDEVRKQNIETNQRLTASLSEANAIIHRRQEGILLLRKALEECQNNFKNSYCFWRATSRRRAIIGDELMLESRVEVSYEAEEVRNVSTNGSR